MNCRTRSLAVVASMLVSVPAAQAGPIQDFLCRPSQAGVVVTQHWHGQTRTQYTYPGKTSGFQAPGWIKFGYPGENYPTSRNYGGPGYVGF